MAEAFLRDRLGYRGVGLVSRGFVRAGSQSPTDTVEAMDLYRFDLRDHRSAVVTADEMGVADLILGMEFDHARRLAAMAPDRMHAVYTLPELVLRGEEGPPRPDESLDVWLTRLHESRPRHPHMGARREYEVDDPFGRPARAHRQAAATIADLSDRLAALIVGQVSAPDRP